MWWSYFAVRFGDVSLPEPALIAPIGFVALTTAEGHFVTPDDRRATDHAQSTPHFSCAGVLDLDVGTARRISRGAALDHPPCRRPPSVPPRTSSSPIEWNPMELFFPPALIRATRLCSTENRAWIRHRQCRIICGTRPETRATACAKVNKAAAAASGEIQSDLQALRDDFGRLAEQVGDILSNKGNAACGAPKVERRRRRSDGPG